MAGLQLKRVFLKEQRFLISDIDNKFLKKVKKNPLNNKRPFSYECDASNENDVKNLFKQISKKLKIDALINNVGIAGPTGTIENLNQKIGKKH